MHYSDTQHSVHFLGAKTDRTNNTTKFFTILFLHLYHFIERNITRKHYVFICIVFWHKHFLAHDLHKLLNICSQLMIFLNFTLYKTMFKVLYIYIYTRLCNNIYVSYGIHIKRQLPPATITL